MKQNEPNYPKQKMYAVNAAKIEKALKCGFYYEALLLEYALLEDVLKRILEMLGIINCTSEAVRVTAKARKPLRQMLHLKPQAQFQMRNIQPKLDTFRLSAEYAGDDPLFREISDCLRKTIGIEQIDSVVEDVTKWKDQRNIIVHDLMNQISSEMDAKATELAQDGIKLFRLLDKYTKRVQKADIRKRCKVQ